MEGRGVGVCGSQALLSREPEQWWSALRPAWNQADVCQLDSLVSTTLRITEVENGSSGSGLFTKTVRLSGMLSRDLGMIFLGKG